MINVKTLLMYDENRNPDPTVFYEGADETSSYSEAVSTTIVQSPSPLRLNSVIKKPDVLPESIFDICIQDEIPLLPRSILSLEPAATSNHSETQTAPLDINGNESSSRDRNDLQELSVLIRAVVDKINCIQQNQEDREKINSIIAPLKQFHLGHNSESGAFNAPPGFHGKSNSAFNGIDTDQRSFISPFAKASNANPNTATTNVFICSNYSHNNNNNLQQNLFNQGSSAGFNSNPPASLSLVQPPARSLFKSSLPAPEPTLQSNRIQSNNPFLESQDSLVSQKPVENGQNPFTASIKNPFQNSTRNPFATSTTHETESIYYHQTDEERLKQDSSEEQPSVGETTQRTVFNSQDRPNGLFEDLFSNDSKDYSLTLKTPNQSKVTSFNDLFSNNAPSDHETSLSFRPEPKTTLFSDLFSNSSSEQNSPRKMPQESNNNWAPVDIQEQGSYASIDQLFTGEATPQEDNDLMRSFAITYAEPPVKWSTATEEVNPGATLFNNATDTNSSEDCQEVQTVACLRDYQQLTCQMTDEIPVYENGLILCGTLGEYTTITI